MLKQLKKVLVESFVGAIAIGWIFSQGILHFTFIFSAPVASWIQRRQYGELISGTHISTTFSLQDAVPDLVRSIALLLVGYLLLRWLYFNPVEEEMATPGPEQSD
jgi:hypothetical protein